MLSLKDKFEEIRHRLAHARQIDSAGTEPIYYLVFPVSELIEVKRQTKAWTAKLENDGWKVTTLSLAESIESFLGSHKLRKFWLQSEKLIAADSEKNHAPLDCREINKTLTSALCHNSKLVPEFLKLIDSKRDEAESEPNGLLLITDLESLHPYLRINTIEEHLRTTMSRPVVVLYPGAREGKTSLRFLEFYPPDPNYRSEHIG